MQAIKRALIVIDVQNEYVTGNLRVEYPPVAESLLQIGHAMDAAHAAGIPIVLVQHDAPVDSPLFAVGSETWALHAVVAGRPYDHLIHKTQPSSFAGTDLEAWLAGHGVNTLTVAGYMTQNCNLATIVAAAHMGLSVEMLGDASGAIPYENAQGRASAEEIHRVLSVVFHGRMAAVMNTTQWIANVQAGTASERSNIYVSNQQAVASRALGGR